MMKLFIRFLFSLCILLTGYSHLKATTPRDHVSTSSDRMLIFIEQGDEMLNIRNHPHSFERLNLKFTETNNEDDTDEMTAFKKHLAIGNNFTTVFSPPATDTLHPYFLSNSYPLSSTAQSLYIRHGVLRI
ncbi:MULTISPECIES: hypothetical protein [unclassified Chitinophaga]|uniref:hypothetical protein n=1 Tax=unclassified Chitinophaga TaxID=2619133 RepID=UPI0009CF8A09|nr:MULTISPECIES: hypothetical protein [unclassified Chitinophaga]OMP80867.1 hypothetical protein BW716_02325 [[Flexibacter] sp. ATCC 35208]WPV69992.1 hypothetical protein QQL36_14910 [Chitinophaga sp. LS1]